MTGAGSFPTSMRPLPGGHSGETFLAGAGGEQVVVRVYAGRSAARGPQAPEVDAAVLDLVRGLLPVPEVLEVRPGDVAHGLPGLLVTSVLPGNRLEDLLPDLDPASRERVGSALGTLVGRLAHMVQPRAGLFADRTLALQDLPAELRDLPAWLEHHRAGLVEALGAEPVEALAPVVAAAQDLLDSDRRRCLVHGDLNAANLLVDRVTLEVTGVLDWEFAHAGAAYEDLGNLLRHQREPAFTEAVLGSYADLVPRTPADLLERARAADLWALLELAARGEATDPVLRARSLLRAVARSGDVGRGAEGDGAP